MEPMGIRKSPSGLELTIAVPGHGLDSSFGSDGRSGFNNDGNARELVLLDMNHPAASGGEESSRMGSVEIMEDEEERGGGGGGGGGGSQRSKKLRLSNEQYQLLEENFRLNHTIDPRQREALAERLMLRPRQVEVWFQNRRARSKLKNTEMECEYLRQCFGTLTEKNRRLQREVEELRAMRVAPPASALATPPSAPALAMVCPHCERVVTPAAAAQQAAGAWATTSLPPSSSSSYSIQLCCPSLAL